MITWSSIHGTKKYQLQGKCNLNQINSLLTNTKSGFHIASKARQYKLGHRLQNNYDPFETGLSGSHA